MHPIAIVSRGGAGLPLVLDVLEKSYQELRSNQCIFDVLQV
jgi:hypothetical protein